MMKRQKISKSDRFTVLCRDGYKCRYCGRSQHDGATLQVDHVVPVSAGGEHAVSNFVTACSDCNLGKRDRLAGLPVPPQSQSRTYGLSFQKDGRCHWQFEIEETSQHAAKLLTYSWFTGDPYCHETVTAKYLEERCVLFTSHEEFIKAADHWGCMDSDRVMASMVAT